MKLLPARAGITQTVRTQDGDAIPPALSRVDVCFPERKRTGRGTETMPKQVCILIYPDVRKRIPRPHRHLSG